jgi:WD40 repeat protein
MRSTPRRSSRANDDFGDVGHAELGEQACAQPGERGIGPAVGSHQAGRPRPLGPPLTGHTGAVWSVVFSPAGRTLASGTSGDGAIWLWAVR